MDTVQAEEEITARARVRGRREDAPLALDNVEVLDQIRSLGRYRPR